MVTSFATRALGQQRVTERTRNEARRFGRVDMRKREIRILRREPRERREALDLAERGEPRTGRVAGIAPPVGESARDMAVPKNRELQRAM